MNTDIKIPKYIIEEITYYSRKFYKLKNSVSNWNYLMREILKASLEGEGCLEYWSDYDYINKMMIEIIQECKYDLIEHGYQVKIETKDHKNSEEPVIIANVSWYNNFKEE